MAKLIEHLQEEEEMKDLIKKRTYSDNNIDLVDTSKLMTNLFKKIEQKRNSLKKVLIIFFFFLISNIVYNILLYMSFINANYYLLLKKECNFLWEHVFFLNIILLLSCVIFVVYLIDLIEHVFL